MRIIASQILRILTLTYAAYAMGHVLPAWAVKPAFAGLVMSMLAITFAQVYRFWLRRNQSVLILLTALVLWPSLNTDPGAPIVNVLAWCVDKVGTIGTFAFLMATLLARYPLKRKRRPLPAGVQAFVDSLRPAQPVEPEPVAALDTEPEPEPVEVPEPVVVEIPEPAPEPESLPVRKPRAVKPDPSTLSSRRPSGVRVYLHNEFKDNDTVKALGARFDREKKQWYVPANISLRPFRDWLPAA